MTPFALDLDHVGTAVHSLDEGQKAFLKLGFQLTPRSHHKGVSRPGGPVEPWGSANHCAMLQRGYLEVLGIVDQSLFSTAKALLARYEGTHIVAFRPRSMDDVEAQLTAKGLPVDTPRALERMAAYGPGGHETRRVAFRNARFTATVFTEAQFQYTEHLTRDTMWQPHLLEHANGALALDRLYLCAPDPAAIAAKLSPILGIVPTAGAHGGPLLSLEHSDVCILTPQAWQALAPGNPLPPLPAPVGFTVRTASLAQAKGVLKGNAVPYAESAGGGIRVDAAHACGAVIHFTEGSL